jgi:hypothetical protein
MADQGTGQGGVRRWWLDQRSQYAHGKPRPEGSYLALMSAYGAAVAGASVAVWRGKRGLAERPDPRDLVLVSVATGTLSRLLAKDPITSVLRMPFTRYEGRQADAELAEETRGHGAQHAVGELLTCPFCLGMWVATGFGFGLVLAPAQTRFAAGVLTTVFGADVLQYAYSALQQEVSG